MQIQMRVDEQCKVLCRIERLTEGQSKALKEKIDDDYKAHMYVTEAEPACMQTRALGHTCLLAPNIICLLGETTAQPSGPCSTQA